MTAPSPIPPLEAPGRDPEPRPTRAMRLLYFFGPIAITLALWGLVWGLAPRQVATELTVAATASIFALGTAVVLGPAALGDAVKALSTWDLALLVIYLNLALSFFFSYNLDLLQRFPWIGPPLRRARTNALRTLKERPWIRRWATVGVALFVLLPLPGSGSLGGSLVGRLLGLRRLACFLTVSTANVVVCVLYGWFGTGLAALATANELSLPVRMGSLGLMGVGLYFLSRFVSRMLRTSPPGGTAGA